MLAAELHRTCFCQHFMNMYQIEVHQLHVQQGSLGTPGVQGLKEGGGKDCD